MNLFVVSLQQSVCRLHGSAKPTRRLNSTPADHWSEVGVRPDATRCTPPKLAWTWTVSMKQLSSDLDCEISRTRVVITTQASQVTMTRDGGEFEDV